jgi:hypothetical protein
MEIFSFFIAPFSRMRYILGMVNSAHILALVAAIKETPASALTNAQLAALASLATQIEFTLQDRQAEVDEELAQVERFEQDEFIALDAQCDREDRFLDSFWESQTECFGMD